MNTIRNLLTLCVVTVMALPLTGCGEKLPDGMPTPVPCEIVVMQESTPLVGAVVRLHSESDSRWTAMGRTDESGKAVIYTLDRYKGAVPGKYKVLVTKTETDKPAETGSSQSSEGTQATTTLASYNVVEERFGAAATTTLEIEVAKGTPSHTLDVGRAVRLKIEEDRR